MIFQNNIFFFFSENVLTGDRLDDYGKEKGRFRGNFREFPRPVESMMYYGLLVST